MLKPVKVSEVSEYWINPPPQLSARCEYYKQEIANGYSRNKRQRSMGYHEAAEFYGVYIWEFINILYPAFVAMEKQPSINQGS